MNAPLELIEPEAAQKPAQALAQVATATAPLSVIEHAMRSGATADQLERLLELQVRADNHQLELMRERRRMDEEDRKVAAKSAYYAAMAKFKAEGVRVLRNKDITDGPLKGKKHATVSSVSDAANDALSRYGLSAAWRPVVEEKDWIRLSCVISHVDGYSEEASFGGGVDIGPGRNAIQARKSTLSYLERITMELVLGLAEHDDDDDGNGGNVDVSAATEALLRGFRNAAMQGSAELRKHYDATQPTEDFWREHSKALKAAAKTADEGVAK